MRRAAWAPPARAPRRGGAAGADGLLQEAGHLVGAVGGAAARAEPIVHHGAELGDEGAGDELADGRFDAEAGEDLDGHDREGPHHHGGDDGRAPGEGRAGRHQAGRGGAGVGDVGEARAERVGLGGEAGLQGLGLGGVGLGGGADLVRIGGAEDVAQGGLEPGADRGLAGGPEGEADEVGGDAAEEGQEGEEGGHVRRPFG